MNMYNTFIRHLTVLSFAFILLIFAFADESICGGWRSIGPAIGANAHIRSFAINKISQKMYATTDSGLVRRNDDSSWTMVLWNGINYSDPRNLEYDYGKIWSDPFIDSLWFFGWMVSGIDPGEALSFSKNPEDHWNTIPPNCFGITTYAVAFDPVDAGTAYIYLCSPYVSHDTCRTWTYIISSEYLNATEISFDEIIRNNIYFATYNGVYRLKADSASWSLLRDDVVQSILARNDTIVLGAFDGITFSFDGGGTWSQVLSDSITSMVRNPHSSNTIFAGSSAGVIYRSEDGGSHWNIYNNTLPKFPVQQLLFDGLSDTLYVGTYGAGIVKVFNTEVGVKEPATSLPTAFKLYPPYPNPFNPSVMISYDLPKRSYVRVDVFNVLGQSLLTIFDGMQEMGNHHQTFNADRWSSGTYFIKVTSGGHVASEPVVLIR